MSSCFVLRDLYEKKHLRRSKKEGGSACEHFVCLSGAEILVSSFVVDRESLSSYFFVASLLSLSRALVSGETRKAH